jgi:hypothetical protein
VAAFCQSALGRSRLEVESSARRHRAHLTSYVVKMGRISPSWRCILSTPSVKGRSNVFRSVVVVA